MTADDRDLDGPEYDYFDPVDEEEDQGSRGPIFAVVGLIVLAAFMGVVWVAYHQGVREGRRQLPTLVADAGPIKEIPAGAGEKKGPDSPALEAMGGETPNTPEVLMPPPEAPIEAPPAPAATDVAPPPDAPGAAEADEPGPDAAPAPAVAPTPAPAVDAAKPAPAVPVAPIVAGDFLVQIAAFRSDTEAEQAWTKLQGKNEDLLKDYSPNVLQADLGAKGIYYRLRFGPFKDRADAISVCESLKARNQDCLVVKSS